MDTFRCFLCNWFVLSSNRVVFVLEYRANPVWYLLTVSCIFLLYPSIIRLRRICFRDTPCYGITYSSLECDCRLLHFILCRQSMLPFFWGGCLDSVRCSRSNLHIFIALFIRTCFLLYPVIHFTLATLINFMLSKHSFFIYLIFPVCHALFLVY